MDREFMKSFLQNYYTDYQSEAVKDSAEYQESKKKAVWDRGKVWIDASRLFKRIGWIIRWLP